MLSFFDLDRVTFSIGAPFCAPPGAQKHALGSRKGALTTGALKHAPGSRKGAPTGALKHAPGAQRHAPIGVQKGAPVGAGLIPSSIY
jgi:hypothetical protein